MRKELKGKLSILMSRNDTNSRVFVRLTDTLSGAEFLCAEVDGLAFMQALTGLGFVPCDYILRGIHVVGKKHEHKSVIVPVERPSIEYPTSEFAKDLEEAVKPFEVDGWKADIYMSNNCWTKSGYKVVFRRYVEVPEGYVHE